MNQQQKSLKVLLLGDSCYDYYHYGEVNRISPEAPIPVLDHLYQEIKPGMCSNVQSNFRSLGIEAETITAFLEYKRRYIDIKSKQQVLRVDERISNEKCLIRTISNINDFDVIVISDYNKGFLSYDDIRYIRDNYYGPIFMDTKKTDLAEFENIIVKINNHEFRNLKSRPKNLIVTNGEESVTWYKSYLNKNQIFFPPKVEAYDVCGAGDTFLAALVYSYMQNDRNLEKGILFAMKAAAITVRKSGVYAPSLEEIEKNDKT